MVMARVNPNDFGVRKWSRLAKKHPANPAGRAPTA